MGIPKRWSRISGWNLVNIPDEPVAYEIADRFKRTIDIGGSGNLAETASGPGGVVATARREGLYRNWRSPPDPGEKSPGAR